MYRITETILILAAITILWAPQFSMVAGVKPRFDIASVPEPAAMPKLSADCESLEGFPGRFRAWFADNYGFRPALMKAKSYLMTKLVRNTRKKTILIGRDKWLFWTGQDVLEKHSACRPLPEKELRRGARILAERNHYCKKRGIRYLYVVVPTKHTVYPEYLPDWLVRTDRRSHLGQFLEYLDKNTDVEYLNLTKPLFSAKEKRLVYFSNDTHWTEYGAWVGYRAIVERIGEWFPRMEPIPLSDFDFMQKPRLCDMAYMLGLTRHYPETVTGLEPRRPFRAEYVRLPEEYVKRFPKQVINKENPVNEIGLFITETGAGGLPRGVFFRDSFAQFFVPWMSEHFSRAVYYWYLHDRKKCDFQEYFIEREAPDLVVTEIGERAFLSIKENSPAVREEYNEKLYKN